MVEMFRSVKGDINMMPGMYCLKIVHTHVHTIQGLYTMFHCIILNWYVVQGEHRQKNETDIL
jgi:hypothetical protein